MGGAKGIVDEDVAQLGHFLGQLGLVLLFAHVHAAVLQQHHLAGGNLHAVHPVGNQRHFAAQQLRQALRHSDQRVGGLEFAFGGAPQVAGHHHGSTRLQCHLNGRHRGAHARVFGDFTGVAQRYVQIRTDENALALDFALGAQIRKANDVHGVKPSSLIEV